MSITLYTEDWPNKNEFRAEEFDRVTKHFAFKGKQRVALEDFYRKYFRTMEEAITFARERRKREVENGHGDLERAKRRITIAQARLYSFNVRYPECAQ